MSISNEIEFQLAGKDAVLRPNIKAARLVSRLAGGFNGVYRQLANEDLDVVTAVIKAGLVTPKMSTDDIEQAIYETGTSKLFETCAKYVRLLQNGGRSEEAEDDGSEAQSGNG